MGYLNIILISIFVLLIYFYHWLKNNESRYDKMFGKGSTKFVLGELTIILGIYVILFLISLYYNYFF
jgi:hypothetical protein